MGKRLLSYFTFRDVTDNANENALAFEQDFANGKFDWKPGFVFAQCDYFTVLADNSLLASFKVSLEITVVLAPHGFGHEQIDFFAYDLIRRIAKNPFGCRAEALNHTVLANDYDAVSRIFNDGTDAHLAILKFLSAFSDFCFQSLDQLMQCFTHNIEASGKVRDFVTTTRVDSDAKVTFRKTLSLGS